MMNTRTMVRTICYRVNATGEEYLAYITYKTIEEAQAEAEALNKNKPERLWNREFAHCDTRTYFASEQESFY